MQKRKKINLNSEIQRILDLMQKHEPTSDEYHNLLIRLDRLYEIKERGRNGKTITGDGIMNVGASIAKTLLVLNFEKFDSIRSKAFMFIK